MKQLRKYEESVGNLQEFQRSQLIHTPTGGSRLNSSRSRSSRGLGSTPVLPWRAEDMTGWESPGMGSQSAMLDLVVTNSPEIY